MRFDEDEIGIPDAEHTGVNRPATVSAHDDGPSLRIFEQALSISRTKAVIRWMSVKKGTVYATIAQDTAAEEFTALNFLYWKYNGISAIPDVSITGPSVITKDNIK